MHDDICGLIKSAAPGGKTLFLLLIDDKSRFMWLILLQAKSEAVEAIKRIQAQAEAEYRKKMRVLCTARGEEFTFTTFDKYCEKLDIQQHLMALYSPPAERGGGVPKLDHRRDSKVITNDGRDAWEVLEKDGNDGRLPPQSIANAKPRREDTTRGLVQQEASSMSSPSVRLRCIHERRTSPPRQARS